jgi:hypothetical protein
MLETQQHWLIIKFKINENHQIITYDIKDLYVNILIQETLEITKSMLLKENSTQITNRSLPYWKPFLNKTTSHFKTIYTNQKKELLWDHLYLAQQQKYSYNT